MARLLASWIGSLALACLALGVASIRAEEPRALKVSGEIKLRGEVRKGADFGLGEAGDEEFVGQLTRLALSGEVKNLRYFVEIVDGRDHGAERKSGTVHATGMHQGFLEFGGKTQVRLGRQEVSWGQKRLIGSSGWAYKELPAYDGLRVLHQGGHLQLDAFAVKVAEKNLDERDDTSLGGASGSWKFTKQASAGLYFMYWGQGDDTKTTANEEVKMPVFGSLGAFGPYRGMSLDYEAALETGTRGSKEHRAYLLHGALVWKEPGKGRYWFGLEYNLASGDLDPTDNESQGFEKLYGINHAHYGIIDYQDPRNMRDLRLLAGIKPSKRSQIQCDVHRFSLDEPKDAWFSANAAVALQDRTGASGRDVGWEWDAVLQFDITPQQKIEVGFSHFSPGAFVRATNQGNASGSQWGYVQLRALF